MFPRAPKRDAGAPVAEQPRLGDLLIQLGLITEDQLKQALALQKEDPARPKLGNILIAQGLITESHLGRALSNQFHVEQIDFSDTEIEMAALELVPEQWAVRHRALPLRVEGDVLVMATSDPTNHWLVEDIGQVTSKTIKLCVAAESDIRVQLRRQYEHLRSRQKEAAEGAARSGVAPPDAGSDIPVDMWKNAPKTKSDNMLDFGPLGAGEQGAVQIVDKIIGEAIRKGTSDVSLLSQDNGIVVRYKVDGVFQDVALVPRSFHASVVSRIKILCDLDVTEHRRPLDGRFRFRAGEEEADLRVAVFPTMFGESAVIRILERIEGMPELDALGIRPPQLEILLEHSRQPQGFLLLTGPTGSGKTTTIYALLKEIYTPQLNILTLEDPVEYQMAGIGQVQINEKAGLTFATGLRSFLRAAPNVILVGEVRDLETADLAFQAALTGHLVMSTLHTNDAVSTVFRLLSMGVEPYVMSSSLSLIVAQRLMRRVCPSCKRQMKPSPTILRLLHITEEQADQHTFYGGTGCDKCDGMGYKGRIGIYEVLTVNDEMRDSILKGGSEAEICRIARSNGVRSLRQEALARAFQGQTTLEEIVRVTESREQIEDRCPRCGLPLPAPGRPCPKCAVLATATSAASHSGQDGAYSPGS